MALVITGGWLHLGYPQPELNDDVVRLRPWTRDDLGCIEQAGHDPRIPRGTSVPASFTPAEGVAFIERQWSRLTEGLGVSQAITDVGTDQAVGLMWLALRPQPGVVGIGYWLVPDARARGLAARAVDLTATWALGELGVARVEAWVEPDNVASQRTLATAGFEREGVLRNFLTIDDRRTDAVVYSRIA